MEAILRESNLMQMYGNFEEFPVIMHCLGW